MSLDKIITKAKLFLEKHKCRFRINENYEKYVAVITGIDKHYPYTCQVFSNYTPQSCAFSGTTRYFNLWGCWCYHSRSPSISWVVLFLIFCKIHHDHSSIQRVAQIIHPAVCHKYRILNINGPKFVQSTLDIPQMSMILRELLFMVGRGKEYTVISMYTGFTLSKNDRYGQRFNNSLRREYYAKKKYSSVIISPPLLFKNIKVSQLTEAIHINKECELEFKPIDGSKYYDQYERYCTETSYMVKFFIFIFFIFFFYKYYKIFRLKSMVIFIWVH